MTDPDKRERNTNVLRQFTVPIITPLGEIKGRYREYIEFDAEQMVRETKISVNPLKEQSVAKAKKGEASVTFSVMRSGSNTLMYVVTVSGVEEDKKAIVEEFKRMFGSQTENVPWTSVSFLGAHERDSYVWHAIMRGTK